MYFSLSPRAWTLPAAELICLVLLKRHSHPTLQIQTLTFSPNPLVNSVPHPWYWLCCLSNTFPSWFSSLNYQCYSPISIINFSVFLWFKSVDPTVMKTRDTRWRQFEAGHKEALQGHTEKVFPWQLSSSIPLFSGACLPDSVSASKLCQSSAPTFCPWQNTSDQ